MRRLFEIDLKDYKDTYSVFRRPSARAIIIKDNKIALVYSKKEKYYKFPGGGIHEEEDDYFNEIMIKREKRVLEMLKQECQ